MTQDGSAASSLVGTVLAGRYRILEKLGEGAMGAVYLGEHLKIGRRDAIKVLRDTHARDTEAIARFLRGARNVSTIHHPNVCAIYDFSDAEGGIQFLAMEYIAGETLKDTLERETRLPLERALHIAKQTASALDAAHDVGIVHRDLKPGNIMLVTGRDGRDHVKVVDFDIAKGPEGGEEVTRLGFVVGTPEYMSPEQLMGEPLDGRSDVYSLAIVLFRMLTGLLPFRGETTQDLMIQRLTNPPLTVEEALPGAVVPERLRSLLDRALQRRQADRIASAADFEQEIVLLQADLTPEAARQPAASMPPGATIAGTRSAPSPELPQTRVSPAASQAPEPTKAVASGRAPARKRIGLGVAVGAIVLVAALGLGAVLLKSGPTSETPADIPDVTTGVSEQGATEQSPTQSSVSEPPPAVAAADARREDPPAPPTRDDRRESTMPAADARAAIHIPADRVSDVLLEQLEMLDSQPGPRAVNAVIDTATAVWQSRGLQVNDRALAAYVLASVYAVRSEWARCARWLDSALALTPDDAGFKSLRTNCPEQRR